MSGIIRKKKYIAPEITKIDMKNTTILAGSGGPKYDTSENKIDFNSSESTNGSWGGAKAPMRQNIGDWSEEE